MIGRPDQWREPNQIPMSEREIVVVKEEIHSITQKGALAEVQSVKGQLISTIFVRPKKEPNKFLPIINLKKLNSLMPYIHFKMQDLKNVSNFNYTFIYFIIVLASSKFSA